jgi:hypothetical protein
LKLEKHVEEEESSCERKLSRANYRRGSVDHMMIVQPGLRSGLLRALPKPVLRLGH